MELFNASNQWATRPADERASTLRELHTRALESRVATVGGIAKSQDLEAVASDNNVQLVGTTGVAADISHWAFTQLSTTAGAPARYLRKLPAQLAADNLNHGLKAFAREEQRLLIHERTGNPLIRAVTSNIYSRIWNHEVTQRLLDLPDFWTVPPAMDAATKPSGLYISPEDLFVFMVDESHRINDGTDQGVARGFFVQNSEVGKSSLKVVTFRYRYICGNHIVWGAQNVREISIRHVGDIREKFDQQFLVQLSEWANDSATADEVHIKRSQTQVIGGTKDEVLDALFNASVASRKALGAAYDAAEESGVDGDPRSYWGMAQGLSRISQEKLNADSRTVLDTAAGRVLEMVPF